MAYAGNNPPTQLEINNMLSELDGNESVVKGCRFIVRINPTGLLTRLSYSNQVNKLIYACDGAEFPGRAFQVTEVRYYGPKQIMPSNTIYGDGINMSFICRSKTVERQFFDDWMDIINPPTSYHFRYPNQYYTDIEIFQYAEFGSTQGSLVTTESVKGIPNEANPQNKYAPQPIYGWRLLKAWPTMVQPQPVTWADSDILRLQVTFAYKNWERPGDSEQASRNINTIA
jgi:hypothetical protein